MPRNWTLPDEAANAALEAARQNAKVPTVDDLSEQSRRNAIAGAQLELTLKNLGNVFLSSKRYARQGSYILIPRSEIQRLRQGLIPQE